MFIVILGTVLGLMHLYVWKRLIKDTTRGRPRWVLTAGFVGLLVLLVATLLLPQDHRVAGVGVARMARIRLVRSDRLPVSHSAGVRAGPYCLARLGEAQVAAQRLSRTQQAMNRRVFLARTSAVAAGVASVGLVGVGVANALGPPDLLRVPVRLRRLDPAFNGFRIAVVSDIHLGPLAGRAHTERIVAMINETEPDLVAIVGDLVDGTVEELGLCGGTVAGLGVPGRCLLRHRQPRVFRRRHGRLAT